MIKHVHIKNYKSLEDVSVTLGPVTILIGRSGSGKSNFVEALRWLRDYLIHRNDSEVQRRHGGWDQILCATGHNPMAFSFVLTFDPRASQKISGTNCGSNSNRSRNRRSSWKRSWPWATESYSTSCRGHGSSL